MNRAIILKATLLVFFLTTLMPGQTTSAPSVATRPPMGWNSWDSYGTTVREDQVKDNADVMARDLAKYGWRYIVVDIQWYEPNAQGHDYKPGAPLTMDDYGRLIPAVNRFPSSANRKGFKPLADYVHSKGLKFGIHIMRGIPRQAVAKNTPIKGSRHRAGEIADKKNVCRWNPDMYGVDMTKPGAQDYYDSIAQLYASWGVDFIKADDMGSHSFQPAEIKALSEAIRKTRRPMVLSISPGPAPVSEASFFEQYAQMWRISDDFWDDWKLLKKQFNYMREWYAFVGKNATWPDADMLPLGKLRVTDKEGMGTPTKFTRDEQYTLMTLWCIFRSPLIFGGDLPSNDEFTTSLITNPEVLAVDQESSNNHPVLESDNFIAWIADVPGSSDKYLAVFNPGEAEETLRTSWRKLGLEFDRAAVRDLWLRKTVGTQDAMVITLRPHASILYRVSPR
ncbi:MAG: glycoside hydrolase family 27 protein [Acidobacteriaceae bacterium]